MIPRATYRFQFHRDFPFAAAEALVPYLDDLGVSHVYASPITTARSGSMHGYDVVDPRRVNPELGGEEGLRALVAALRGRGMGLIIDIVPNHMGVAGGENAWWNDVLQHGEASAFARFFDIDWRCRLLLPILGTPLEQALTEGAIAIDRSGGEPMLTAYGEHRLPIRPEDHADVPTTGDRAALAALLERQHYRLGWWRTADDELNWRRFFTVNDLAGLRVEDPQVFEETHALYFRLWREGLIDGVRIDHIDGLTDPAAYCRALRKRLDALSGEREDGARAWIVVEKILGPGEELATDWGIDGTSGYDFMEEVSALLHDIDGKAELEDLWHKVSGCGDDFHAYELRARQDMLSWAFDAQFRACVEAFAALAATAPEASGLTQSMLSRAVQRLLWSFPVYRTYGTGSAAPPQDARVRTIAREGAARFTPPGEEDVSDLIVTWLAGEGPGDSGLAAEAVRRFQQLSAPIAAKSVEDTAFYRYGLLLSRTDVGFDASRFATGTGDFHDWCEQRAATFPHAMLATATHDHKRGEDMRARLAVLSGIPGRWRENFEAWDHLACERLGGDAVHPVDRYFIFQTVYGAWPADLDADAHGLADFAGRLVDWNMKSLREGKQRSSWERPDTAYEEICARLIRMLLDPVAGADFVAGMARFVADTSAAATANTLVQTALRCLVAGVPDLYQGAEMGDFSLVDPDNRRPVDFDVRRRALKEPDTGHPKIALIRRLLDLRRDNAALFRDGAYEPLCVSGRRRSHVLAFRRRHEDGEKTFAVAVKLANALWRSETLVPPADWWQGTRIALGDGQKISAAEVFRQTPVHLGGD